MWQIFSSWAFFVLQQSFSKFNVQANHLGVSLKCRFWVSCSEEALISDPKIITSSQGRCCRSLDHNSSSKILGHLGADKSNDHEAVRPQTQGRLWGHQKGFLSTLEFAEWPKANHKGAVASMRFKWLCGHLTHLPQQGLGESVAGQLLLWTGFGESA